MSFFHASQRDALNQSLAEVQGQILEHYYLLESLGAPISSDLARIQSDNHLQ